MQKYYFKQSLNISAACGDREEVYRLIGRKSRKFIFCCNNEIGVVDSLPLNEIDQKVDSDSDGEDEIKGPVEMIEEIKVAEYIEMAIEMELRWRKNDCNVVLFKNYLFSKI